MTAPQLTVQIQGQGVVSADQLNTYEQTCDNVPELRAFVGAPGVQTFIRGLSTPGDGGAGPFWWNPSGTGPDDGVNIIVPPGAITGCWVRLGSFGNNDLIPTVATFNGTLIKLVIEGSYRVPVVPFPSPLFFAFISPAANTGPFTLSVNGVNVANLYDGPDASNTTAALAQYQTCLVCWNPSINGGAGGYVLINPSLSTGQGGVPSGTVIMFAGPVSTVPSGYLVPYGQAVSRATYATLFSLFGTTYGSGDGSSTFNLPDLRGRAIFGLDNMGGSGAGRLTGATTQGINAVSLGAAGGEQAHTQLLAELVAHSHSATVAPAANYANQASSTLVINSGGGWGAAPIVVTIGSVGSGAAFNVVPPGIAMNVLIKT